MNPNSYIQPKLKARVLTRAGGIGVALQARALTQAGVGMARKARVLTHACRVGMDFDSTD